MREKEKRNRGGRRREIERESDGNRDKRRDTEEKVREEKNKK